MTRLNKVKVLSVKAFMGGQWYTACRRYGTQEEYQVVHAPAGTCIADPFLFEAEGKHYLFVELFERRKNKASIACYQFVDDQPVYLGKVIEQPYHMSYPCVFKYQAAYYMIPETSANQSVELYRAGQFPMQWEKVKTLISGERYVDTTVVKRGGEYCAVSYRKGEHGWMLDCFRLDMEQCALRKLDSVQYARNIGRPAGGFLEEKELLRPAQNCAEKYGENLIFYQVDMSGSGGYMEREAGQIGVRDLPLSIEAHRVHTYNRDSLYECVDVYAEKLDLLHGAKTLWRAYLRPFFHRDHPEGRG